MLRLTGKIAPPGGPALPFLDFSDMELSCRDGILVSKRIRKGKRNAPVNGILYWKGGDYAAELADTPWQPTRTWDLAQLLPEGGFEEKFLIHLKA